MLCSFQKSRSSFFCVCRISDFWEPWKSHETLNHRSTFYRLSDPTTTRCLSIFHSNLRRFEVTSAASHLSFLSNHFSEFCWGRTFCNRHHSEHDIPWGFSNTVDLTTCKFISLIRYFFASLLAFKQTILYVQINPVNCQAIPFTWLLLNFFLLFNVHLVRL